MVKWFSVKNMQSKFRQKLCDKKLYWLEMGVVQPVKIVCCAGHGNKKVLQLDPIGR